MDDQQIKSAVRETYGGLARRFQKGEVTGCCGDSQVVSLYDPQEFAAFRTDYNESRERMTEILDIIRLGLTQEWFEYSGTHYKIPRTTIRPRPYTKDLTRNMLMTWSSPETRDLAARDERIEQLSSSDHVRPLHVMCADL